MILVRAAPNIIESIRPIAQTISMTEDNVLINLRRIPIVRHPKLKIPKNPFLDKEYFLLRKLKLHSPIAA